MLADIVKKGSTDRAVTVRIIDSTDGTPETGVVYNTSGIDLWYRREGAAKTSITEATLAALTTAHSDGGFLHISDGVYRLDLPDAAFATGANHVDFGGTVTGMVVLGGRVRLVDYDPEDTVRLGLTSLPNAAAEAAGGLYTRGSGAGQLSQSANGELGVATLAKTLTTYTGNTPQTGDSYARLGAPAGASVSADVAAVKVDTAAILVDTGTTLDAKIDAIDDYVDTEIAAIKAKTDNLPASPAAVGSAMTLADDAITAAKFDESTAFPLKAADTGSTYIARTGADSDTLETLSDQIDGVTGGGGPSAADIADAVLDEILSGHTTSGSLGKVVADILVDTAEIGAAGAGLTAVPWNAAWAAQVRAAVGLAAANLDTQLGGIDTVVDAIKAVTDNLPDSGALTALLADVAAILVDTGTTLDAKLDAIDNYIDTEVAAILEDTGTTIPGLIAALNDLSVADVWDEVAEGTYTARQCLKIFMSALAGKLSGAATTTVAIRDSADSKNVIVATVDADGNRSAVTLNP